jgi:hypothetical protein
MADGLKKHSHADRQGVVERLTPIIQERFGENLVALASQASFARGDDANYSDLELIVFLKKTPDGQPWGGVGHIIDGLLVELLWTTRDQYLKDIKKKPTKDWYLAGSDVLCPILNEEFIREVSEHPIEVTEQDTLALLNDHWSEVQESTSKVLKAIAAKDASGLPLVYGDMIRHVLIALSLLNRRPYSTYARQVDEALSFSVKPSRLYELVGPLKTGFGSIPNLEEVVMTNFEELEQLLYEKGVEPYDESLDAFGRE